METTQLNVQSCTFVNALERVLPRHGYRSVRSFDLHMDDNVVPQPRDKATQCSCGCDYTVMLVFANAPGASLEGTISVRGNADAAVVSLSSPEANSEFAARFPCILVEALEMKTMDGGKLCRCTHD
jgi:hypothetical protein